jgi:hypothetical protein
MNITLNYKGKSFVVSGSTKEFKDQLMSLGGKYNPHLTTGPGFIFFNKRENEEQEVTDFVNNHNKSPNNNEDLLSINNIKSLITNKTGIVRSPLPSTKSSINYPNRFVGSDGLSYQIIINTCPLPYLNQKVTVKYSDDSFDSTISDINEGSPINNIVLTYQEEDIVKQTRAIIMNGKWQIYQFIQNHELIFHA